jgi:polyhydroxybutyrate depolymerase
VGIQKIVVVLLVVGVLASMCYFAASLHDSADVLPRQSVIVEGQTRYFRAIVPRELPNNRPILFAFHGAGDTAESMAAYSGLDELAVENSFVLVYPFASDGVWAVDADRDGDYSGNPDVKFFDVLLEVSKHRFTIDPTRVYVAGMSNGGSFAQLLVNERAGRIAAAAACSGVAPDGLSLVQQQVSICFIVGSEDRIFDSVGADFRRYKDAGHEVELVVVDGLKHEWSNDHNDKIWDFLSAHRTSQK